MHPVAILSVVYCVICSLLMFVSNAIGDHMVEMYSSMGLVMALYVARIVSFCSSSCVLYSAGSGVKRVHVVLSGLRMRLFVLSPCMYFM